MDADGEDEDADELSEESKEDEADSEEAKALRPACLHPAQPRFNPPSSAASLCYYPQLDLNFGRGLVDINFTMWPLLKRLDIDNILTIYEVHRPGAHMLHTILFYAPAKLTNFLMETAVCTIRLRIPSFIRNLACWITNSAFMGDSLFSRFFALERVKSVFEFTRFSDKRTQVCTVWYEEVSGSTSDDFTWLIVLRRGTSAVLTGLSHLCSHFQDYLRDCAYLSALTAATVLYNVIDSPVGTIPVTHVDPGTNQVPAGFKPGVAGRSKLFEERMYMGKTPDYTPSTIKIDSLSMSVLACPRIDHELAKPALSSSAQTQKTRMPHLKDLRTVPIIYLRGPTTNPIVRLRNPTTSPVVRNARTIAQTPRTSSFVLDPTHPRRPSLYM
ncbi:hypothetical protein M405DRAFT_859196 [Rhizopogon salebrosus TDB-379]|nr:hypothetical protein M405DRAFT_859196 [Rhizopogon salebrosus TDB-379]